MIDSTHLSHSYALSVRVSSACSGAAMTMPTNEGISPMEHNCPSLVIVTLSTISANVQRHEWLSLQDISLWANSTTLLADLLCRQHETGLCKVCVVFSELTCPREFTPWSGIGMEECTFAPKTNKKTQFSSTPSRWCEIVSESFFFLVQWSWRRFS